MEKTVIRSRRKTVGLEIGPRGLIVRAPLRMSDARIEEFLTERRDWIQKHMARYAARQAEAAAVEKLTSDGLAALVKSAKSYIPLRVAHYAPLVGVDYGRINIRSQRSRWGSCSSKGNLNFNCLLMLAPPEVLDSVVVHELCHRKEMNHSPRFYAEVLRVFPEYRKWNRWLKDNGALLMARLPEE